MLGPITPPNVGTLPWETLVVVVLHRDSMRPNGNQKRKQWPRVTQGSAYWLRFAFSSWNTLPSSPPPTCPKGVIYFHSQFGDPLMRTKLNEEPWPLSGCVEEATKAQDPLPWQELKRAPGAGQGLSFPCLWADCNFWILLSSSGGQVSFNLK